MKTISPRTAFLRSRPERREALELQFPYPPSVNNLYNNVPGRGRVTSSFYEDWKVSAAATAMFKAHSYVSGRVQITMTFEEKPGQHDLDNLAKAILDLLWGQYIIENDHSKIVRRLILQWGTESGVLVEIRPYDA